MSGDHPPGVPTRLRVQWAVVAVGALAAVGVGDLLLSAAVGDAASTRWLVVTGGVLAFELWFLYRRLDQNRVAGSVRPSIGPGNAITLVRGALYAVVAGFVLVRPTPAVAWVPGLCYGAGAALDWIDGRTARWTGHVTALGEQLDMAFDTLGFLVAPLVAVAWGRLPVWYLSLSAARYLFRAGRGLRRRRGRPVFDLPDSRLRRPLAGLQMAFIAIALPPVVTAETLHFAAAVVLAPSLVVFVRDYLVVTGRLPHEDA